MEDRYSKYKKLNWLLSESFEAEKVYYHASEPRVRKLKTV